MYFELISTINGAETIAQGHGIRYEAHGIGRREEKIKTVLRVLP